jgi:glutathione S-transferase
MPATTPNTPILHHYALSPFSEKVRKVLGYKGMHWRSVQQPPVLPKPHQVALTGGYRKAPVLQVGRDIYCDTKLICRVIDRLQPDRPLIPASVSATAPMVERWVDQTMFFHAVALFFTPAGMAAFAKVTPPGLTVEGFMQDRGAMFAQGGTQPPPSLEATRAEMPAILASLETQLGANPFLCGGAPTQIDFSIYNPLWFIWANQGTRPELDGHPKVLAWIERIHAIGEGSREEMSGEDAVTFCRACTGWQAPLAGAALKLPQAGLGDRVKIGASDYAPDLVEGELVIANASELAIRREDPKAGSSIVHFPAEAFTLKKA